MAMTPSTKHSPRPRAGDGTGTVLSHMPAIDGLRGIAILMVLIHHFTPAVSGSTFTRRMLTTAHTGWIGVDLFFVLSGFLITCILLKTRSGPDYFLNFYARRTLRIFPIYYLTLIVLLVVLPALLAIPTLGPVINDLFYKTTRDLQSMLDGQSWLWLYGSNLKVALDGERWGAVNHFWSLAVEEHFYMVWPLVVYFVSRGALKRICLACILGAPLLRAMLMLGGFDSVVPYVLTITRVDSLAIGGLLAALITERNGLQKWTPRLTAVAAVSAVMLGSMVIYYNRLDRDDLLTSIFGYSLLATISAWVVLKASQVRIGTRAHTLLANPVLTSLGKYSYGLYVTHMFFVPVFVKLFPWTGLAHFTGSYAWAIVIHAILAIACSWGIAWICFHAFEKHFLKLKSLFDYRRPALNVPPIRHPAPLRTGATPRPAMMPALRQAA